MNDAPKWTPGPWIRKRPEANGELIEIGFAECDADDSGRARWSFEPVATIADTDNEDANCNLIIAAPDLYEELNAMLDRYLSLANSGDCGFWDPEKEDEVIRSRAALAKARGEAGAVIE